MKQIRALVQKVGMLALLCQLCGCYYLKNAYSVGSHLNSRQYIPDLLEDPKTDGALKSKLVFVQEVLDFAEGEGLSTKDTYEYYIDVGDKPVSFLVIAAESDQLKLKTWWFPIVGSVPYLGFFEEEDRDQEASELAAQGFDIHLGEAAAFSGLGWISDPVFSSFLSRRDYSLANMLFHELVHRTFWIDGSVEFNEQLAEYVSGHLTNRFLSGRGQDKELDTFERYKRDRNLYSDWVDDLKGTLGKVFEKKKINQSF